MSRRTKLEFEPLSLEETAKQLGIPRQSPLALASSSIRIFGSGGRFAPLLSSLRLLPVPRVARGREPTALSAVTEAR